MTHTGSPAPAAFTLADATRVPRAFSDDTYATNWTVTAPEPVLVEFEGATWRMFAVLVTDTGATWVSFRRQTKTGRDVARGGFMSCTPANVRVKLSAELAEAVTEAVAKVTA